MWGEPWLQEGDKCPFSILPPWVWRLCQPCITLGNTSGSCPAPSGYSWLPDSRTDRRWQTEGIPAKGGHCQKLTAAEIVMGQIARFGGGWSHHVSPSQRGRKVTFIYGCDSLDTHGASVGCASARDGPREPLLLLLPKSWLSGGCLCSLLQAGRGEAGRVGVVALSCLWCRPQAC